MSAGTRIFIFGGIREKGAFEKEEMPTERKKEIIGELTTILERCAIAITTDYRGLSVAQITELRNRLRQLGVEYRVVKNTLARFAAEQAGKEGLIGIMEGPTAIAFSYDDVVQPAKALSDYVRTSRTPLTIKGALLDRRVLSAEEVQTLSTLPAREVLVANLLSAMQGPIFALVRVLNANPQGLAVLLQARMKQLGGE